MFEIKYVFKYKYHAPPYDLKLIAETAEKTEILHLLVWLKLRRMRWVLVLASSTC